MSGEVVQSVRDRWSHVTATWANNKEIGVSHVGDTSDATLYSKRRKLNIAKSLIVTFNKTRFVNGQFIVAAIPSINPCLVEVNDRDFDEWTLERNDSAHWPA